jgi:hypothetical protein
MNRALILFLCLLADICERVMDWADARINRAANSSIAGKTRGRRSA